MTYQISCATLSFLVILTGTVLAADVNPLDKSPGAKEMTTDSGLKYRMLQLGMDARQPSETQRLCTIPDGW